MAIANFPSVLDEFPQRQQGPESTVAVRSRLPPRPRNLFLGVHLCLRAPSSQRDSPND
jgi:hypothetical protein